MKRRLYNRTSTFPFNQFNAEKRPFAEKYGMIQGLCSTIQRTIATGVPMSRFPIQRRAVRFALTIATVFTLSACATTPKPAPIPSTAPKGAVQTLQSEVTLSLKSAGKSIGGRGYLAFRQPDRFHLVVLSPFGTTVMEIYVSGDRITCLVPSRQTAYQGNLSELPDRNALRAWGLVHWVVDQPPTDSAVPGTHEYLTSDGKREILSFDERGLMTGKINADGDRVAYSEYHDRNGVAFPSTIVMANSRGDTVKMLFSEPDINAPLDDAVLTPDLEGMETLPLSEFKGI